MVIIIGVVVMSVYLIILPRPVRAVMPPDFVFSIGAQVVQFFSIIVAVFSVTLGAAVHFFQSRLSLIKYKKTTLAGVIFFILFSSLTLSYLYAAYSQNAEYQRWLETSQMYNTVDQQNIAENVSEQDGNNRLDIGIDPTNIDTSSTRFITELTEQADKSTAFIVKYYEHIANAEYRSAYDMSKKSVSYEVFKDWYSNTTKIVLNKLVRIDATKSSLELTLFEGEEFTRYGVLMSLHFENDLPASVAQSEVKILGQGSVTADSEVIVNNEAISEEYSFFSLYGNTKVVLSNEEFRQSIDNGQTDYIVLDAREDIEFENGAFPGSIHIRFADLKAGRWLELPKDKFIYVICWSGIRGKEVVEFLRTKKMVSLFLENGAQGWVEAGGQWSGSIHFSDKYTEEQYQTVFTTDQVKEKIHEGILLVDTREPSKFNRWNIPGSVNIPIMYTASIDMPIVFNQVPSGSTVISVCDNYVNCFDAKITGIELERRGNVFIGRYNKPWEYED